MIGLNMRFDVYRPVSGADDAFGGSSVTYTLVISAMKGNLQGSLPDEEIVNLNPGMLTMRELTMTCRPGNSDVRENDVILIRHPSWSPYLNEYMRVTKVSYSNFTPRDRRKYIILTLVKTEEAVVETYVPEAPTNIGFSSGEIGDVDQVTLEILFSGNVQSADFTAGVTIKVNNVAVGVLSGTRQDPLNSLVYYIIDTTVDVNDTVSFEYDSGVGTIQDASNSAEIDSIAEQTIINYVGSHLRFDTEEDSIWLGVI